MGERKFRSVRVPEYAAILTFRIEGGTGDGSG
jgi:hypothetical protein